MTIDRPGFHDRLDSLTPIPDGFEGQVLNDANPGDRRLRHGLSTEPFGNAASGLPQTTLALAVCLR